MKATGIVRRVDDLGRIGKEIRRTLRIREGDPLQTTLTPIDQFCRAIHSVVQRITAEFISLRCILFKLFLKFKVYPNKHAQKYNYNTQNTVKSAEAIGAHKIIISRSARPMEGGREPFQNQNQASNNHCIGARCTKCGNNGFPMLWEKDKAMPKPIGAVECNL